MLQLLKDNQEQKNSDSFSRDSKESQPEPISPPPDEDDEIRLFTWSLKFAQESLKYLMLNFFKRTKLTVKLLANI